MLAQLHVALREKGYELRSSVVETVVEVLQDLQNMTERKLCLVGVGIDSQGGGVFVHYLPCGEKQGEPYVMSFVMDYLSGL
jgi:hypothetical protein